jgi:hypothetical protein
VREHDILGALAKAEGTVGVVSAGENVDLGGTGAHEIFVDAEMIAGDRPWRRASDAGRGGVGCGSDVRVGRGLRLEAQNFGFRDGA